MAIWAIGWRDQPATRFVESSDPAAVLAQMRPGEEIAPVTAEQRTAGVIMLGDMAVADAEPE